MSRACPNVPRSIVNYIESKAIKYEKDQIIQAFYDGMQMPFDPNIGRSELYYQEKYTWIDNE